MEDQVSIDVEALHRLDPECEYVEALAPYPYMMRADDVAEFLGQTRQAVTRHREAALGLERLIDDARGPR